MTRSAGFPARQMRCRSSLSAPVTEVRVIAHPAIDKDTGPGHVARNLRGEDNRKTGHILRLADAPERDLAEQVPGAGRILPDARVNRGSYRTGCNAQYAYAERPSF